MSHMFKSLMISMVLLFPVLIILTLKLFHADLRDLITMSMLYLDGTNMSARSLSSLEMLFWTGYSVVSHDQ